MARRDVLIEDLQELRAVKTQMSPDAYLRELERMLVELARVSRRLRDGSR